MKQIKIPLEVKIESDTKRLEINFNGQTIRAENELLCLTDLWKAVDGTYHNKPKKWLEQADTIEFILEVIRKEKGSAAGTFMERPEKKRKSKKLQFWCSQGKQCAITNGMLKITKGRYGSTFAHWQICPGLCQISVSRVAHAC